jgi:hypothetical protein
LTVAEADRLVGEHLGATPRAAHSRLVARVMRQLAAAVSADGELFEVVGLCHDLDVFATRDDPRQHGILVATWLGERIPPQARDAIAAHDHRTGVQADTLLADALKIADVIAVIDARLGPEGLRAVDRNDPLPALRRRLADAPYLCDNLETYTSRRELSVAAVIGMAAGVC